MTEPPHDVALDATDAAARSGAPPLLEPHVPRSRLQRVFRNDTEVRAGWRFVGFVAIVAPLTAGYFWAVRTAFQGDVERFLAREVAGLMVVFIATAVMARLERRSFGVYGLPWQRSAWRKLGGGMVLGFAWIAALILTLRALGLARGMTLAIHGKAIVMWAVAYLLLFLLLAMREEFLNRGYALFTLGRGIRFWPAAIVLSMLFGLGHRGNSGESWIGLANAGAFGLFGCFLLRRSGDLWLPIGVHLAWDWGQTYFFGTPDSGAVAPGHLLTTSAGAGPAWLSGGTVGPEGSVLCTLSIVLAWIASAAWLPRGDVSTIASPSFASATAPPSAD